MLVRTVNATESQIDTHFKRIEKTPKANRIDVVCCQAFTQMRMRLYIKIKG